MKVGIPKEVVAGETRVAMIPETVKQLAGKGLEVTVERGAGAAGHYSDEAYEQAGAQLSDDHGAVLGGADLVLKVRPPRTAGEDGGDEVAQLAQGATLISFLEPFARVEMLKQLAERGVNALGMEMVPRVSRAQNMDALSSMATIAGYKAVLLAADRFQRFFPMFMTAAGTIAPARVFVLGAGVAGLQAIATAKRLGAVVEAFDVRSAVKEQVESVGGRFVPMQEQADAEAEGGYARELNEEENKRIREHIAGRMPRTDIVISTAQVPGKRAPLLLTEDAVKQLKPGSIVVDLAVETGGNCELSEYDQVVEKHGVTLIGLANLPAYMPVHASQMYAKNLYNLVTQVVGEQQVTLNMDDQVVAGFTVIKDGQVVHPALQQG